RRRRGEVDLRAAAARVRRVPLLRPPRGCRGALDTYPPWAPGPAARVLGAGRAGTAAGARTPTGGRGAGPRGRGAGPGGRGRGRIRGRRGAVRTEEPVAAGTARFQREEARVPQLPPVLQGGRHEWRGRAAVEPGGRRLPAHRASRPAVGLLIAGGGPRAHPP